MTTAKTTEQTQFAVASSDGKMAYLLIEHRHGSDPARIHVYKSEAERDQKTLEAIYDEPLYGFGDASAEEDLATLRKHGWLHFEGDPSVQWINGVLS